MVAALKVTSDAQERCKEYEPDRVCRGEAEDEDHTWILDGTELFTTCMFRADKGLKEVAKGKEGRYGVKTNRCFQKGVGA